MSFIFLGKCLISDKSVENGNKIKKVRHEINEICFEVKAQIPSWPPPRKGAQFFSKSSHAAFLNESKVEYSRKL